MGERVWTCLVYWSPLVEKDTLPTSDPFLGNLITKTWGTHDILPLFFIYIKYFCNFKDTLNNPLAMPAHHPPSRVRDLKAKTC